MRKISAYEVSTNLEIQRVAQKSEREREPSREAMNFWAKVVAQILSVNSRWCFDSIERQRDYTKSLMLGAKEAGLKNQSAIDAGLKHLRTSNCHFMPSVGEFINMCLPNNQKAGLGHNTQAYTNDWTGSSAQLDYKRTPEQKEKAKSKLDEIRAMIKKD